MNTTAVMPTFQTLPLSLLHESTTNPRRTFDETKLIELADSIRTHGLIQPITVRPHGEGYEIVAGARRFRASLLAEVPEVPVCIKELDDRAALEVQIIENAQRADVHPYEEASGYKRLLDLPGYDVAAIAEKCGKSESHIYARLSLLSLIEEVADAFQQDKITASHANQIARLPEAHQADALKACFRADWQDKNEPHLLPVRNLTTWIQSNVFIILNAAPFKLDDDTLIEGVPSCLNCPKRSGFNTKLFADVEGDQCLDGDCFQSKITAHVQAIRTRERTGNSRTKTRQGEQIVWDGCFAGQPLCVISTVRLVGSNLAHFLVSSNARIGSHDWNLRGGHYVDLRVISKHPLSREELLRLGQLAKTEEHRPIYIRQQHERLDDALSVPMA